MTKAPLFDPDYSAESSTPLRYWSGALSSHLTREDLSATTQTEGMRILELGEYRDVRLFLLDETTRMKSGTYKSLDGCVTTAFCRKLGFTRVTFSSGANAGCALTHYGSRAGLETFFFCPAATLFKLNGKLFESPRTHLIAVEGSDRRVKEACRLFSELQDVPLIPKLEWRLAASGVRGFFIAEKMMERNHGFHWLAQAICAGFGPIGLYTALQSLSANQVIARNWIPRFLGVQQEGLSPIADAWSEKLPELQQAARYTNATIEPSLYNTHPSQTYPMLYNVLSNVGGDVMALSKSDFKSYVPDFLNLLGKTDIILTTVSKNGSSEYLENAGLMAGAGALQAIAQGRIEAGSSVLCSLTGGSMPLPDKKAVPEFMITEPFRKRQKPNPIFQDKQDMRIPAETLNEETAHSLLKSCVVPRAIAWVCTVNNKGLPNLAPFSCYTFVATEPPLLCLSIGRKGNGKKDTLRNIEANEQFVVNVPSFPFAEKVNGTAAAFSPDISELHQLGLTPVSSELVKPPRVQGCLIQMECKLSQVLELGRSRHSLVIGEVLLFHIDDIICDQGEVNNRKLNPLFRLSGDFYANLGEIMELKRTS
jgi:flavin reductase (DIM6/NTAB) family NADH-FMN oxidoreductase RutF/threonine synthase